MRLSNLHLPTLREDPAEAELVSHKVMLRAGMIRKMAAGIYSYLPLGLMVLRKVEAIIRDEMVKAGAQEVLLPSLLPAGLWNETGRWAEYGKELLRIRDRHDREFCYGPTHEEAITDLIRSELRSYKQLPATFFQIQTKFRDEIRPRFGVMRAREFIMKDAYSFDASRDDALVTYEQMKAAYGAIFTRCGLRFKAVEADTGLIGGDSSHEFMVLARSGEEEIVSCSACGYSANMEKASCRLDRPESAYSGSENPVEKVETGTSKTAVEVAGFLGLPLTRIAKTIFYMADGEPVAALVRGDLEINDAKLRAALGVEEVVLADAATIKNCCGAAPGYVGPVGLEHVRIVADVSVKGLKNFVTGANQFQHHFINCNIPGDFEPEFADIMAIKEGDQCPECAADINITRGIEVGHIFVLGEKYSSRMKAHFLDKNGKEKPFYMGCYGVGVSRIVAAAIEQNFTEDGMVWPTAMAPFRLQVLPLQTRNTRVMTTAELIYESVKDYGDVLIDDRDMRAGVKFKDAFYIGAPYQLIIGSKKLDEGLVEFADIKKGTRESVPAEDIIPLLKSLLDRRLLQR